MCTLSMDIGNVVSSIAEAMLPRFSDDKTVLVMSFDLAVRKKGDYKGPGIAIKAHLMFHRPHNYTKALWNISTEWDNYRSHRIWKIKSDHDSCWRSDGVSTPFFELGQRMMRELDPKLGCQEVEFSTHFDFITNGEPKIVKLLSYELDRENRTFTVEYAPPEPQTAGRS